MNVNYTCCFLGVKNRFFCWRLLSSSDAQTNVTEKKHTRERRGEEERKNSEHEHEDQLAATWNRWSMSKHVIWRCCSSSSDWLTRTSRGLSMTCPVSLARLDSRKRCDRLRVEVNRVSWHSRKKLLRSCATWYTHRSLLLTFVWR